MKTEKQFVNWLITQIKDTCLVNKIESTTLRGIPDLCILKNGIEVWAEMKVFHGGRVLLRPEQFAWGMRYSSHGGRVFILALHPTGVHGWKFPDVLVLPHPPYVCVGNAPMLITNNSEDIVSSMFT